MPQTYRTSHLTLHDLRTNNVTTTDLIELCVELGEEHGNFGSSSYLPDSSIVAGLQPSLRGRPPTPESPRARLAQLLKNRPPSEYDLMHGVGEAERSARGKAIRHLLEARDARYDEALRLIEERWKVTPKDKCADGSLNCVSQETFEEWKNADLYGKVAVVYRYLYPTPPDPRDVKVFLNDGHSAELKPVRLESAAAIDTVTGIFRDVARRRDADGNLVDSGSGAWMYQLLNVRKKTVCKRRKLLTDRDYRTMVQEIKGKDSKTPFAAIMQESTPVKAAKAGLPVREKQAPVKGVDIPEDIVLEDGTVLSADIDWDEIVEREFGKLEEAMGLGDIFF